MWGGKVSGFEVDCNRAGSFLRQADFEDNQELHVIFVVRIHTHIRVPFFISLGMSLFSCSSELIFLQQIGLGMVRDRCNCKSKGFESNIF